MKAVLKKLKLTNWRGAKNVEINFQPAVTQITGTNEAGKTTLLDAHIWLFTGKDSEDRKDYNIKNTKIESLNRQGHVVEETWLFDSSVQVIRRVFREVWQRPKGKDQEEFKGHETLFFINEVPFNAKQFNETISAWFGETTLKMLTDPMFFNSDNGEKWKWNNKRDILVKMAGEISNEDVFNAAEITQERRIKLEQALSEGKYFDLFKKEISGKKKTVNDELKGLPESILSLEKVTPEKLDWKKIDSQIKEQDELYNSITDSISDLSKVDNETSKLREAKKSEVDALQRDLEAIEEDVKDGFKKENDEVRNKISSVENKIFTIKDDISKASTRIASWSKNVESVQVEKALLLRKLQTEQAKKLPDIDPSETKCPTCGREFDSDKIDDLKKHFTETWNKNHVKEIESIKTLGKGTVSEINNTNAKISAESTSVEKNKAELKKAELELSELKSKPMKAAKELAEALKKHTQYQLNLSKIESIKKEISELETATDEGKKLNLERLKLNQTQIHEVRVDLIRKLASKEYYEKNIKEISDLKEKQKSLNQTKAELEGLEFAIQVFSATKNIEVQKRVNQMFPENIEFKLFETQVNGEDIEFCQLYYKGVPWGTVNNGHKIAAGMECIKAFNKFYNLYLPVFVDNAEALAGYNMPKMETQVVTLRIDENEKDLRVLE